MKTWLPIFLIIAGLSFAIGSNLVQHVAAAETAGAVHEDTRPAPPRKPTAQKREQGPLTFGGYPCPGDCAEDKAGYDWAARNSIDDPDSCTGMTAAFIEGCRVYAERRAPQPL